LGGLFAPRVAPKQTAKKNDLRSAEGAEESGKEHLKSYGGTHVIRRT
jgi:hypothetical protein